MCGVRRQQGVRDAALDGKPVAARGDPSHHLTANAHRLVAECDGARVLENQAGETRTIGDFLGTGESLPAEERNRLVHPHRKTQPSLEWRDLRGDIGRPHPVALLQSQAIDRPVPARDHAHRPAGRPKRVPQQQPVLHWAVELPAQLAHVGDPQRGDGHVPDTDLASGQVRERRVAHVVGDGAGQDVASHRSP